MKKIEKSCNLSTIYKTWEAELAHPHPGYNSSKNKFYTDIVTQLLHCQDGLCAFTERRLCDESTYDASHWKAGKYNSKKPEFEGELDHYNSNRKNEEAWAWENFLVVSTHINQKVKGSKAVDNILKPDHPNYDPSAVLAYNSSTNQFTPNPALDSIEFERVQKMIDVLGINYGSVVRARKEYLNHCFKLSEYETEIDITQFPTAYAMATVLQSTGEQNSILDSFIR